MKTLKIGLIQQANTADLRYNLKKLSENIAAVASHGAELVVLQELHNSLYFCQTEDTRLFDLAEPIPGPSTGFYSELAAMHSVVLVTSLFEKRAPGLAHYTAIILDADGSIAGKYRKMHIPQDPGFEEKFYFAPGDGPFRAWDTQFGRIGVIICWDQWYPESARLTALDGAQIIFCPTAIGCIASESEELGNDQRNAWLNVQKSHPVANGCYYAAVNRVGVEHGTRFWGSSFVLDFYGNALAEGTRDKVEILYAECDLAAAEEHRRMWPFFRDRRIDAYTPLMERYHDQY